MVKEQKSKERRRVLIGLIWSCPPHLKLILTALLLFCSLLILLQFLPFSSSIPHPCAVDVSAPTTTITTSTSTNSQPSDQTLPNGVVKRFLHPVGTAAYNFILMSAYRGGPHSFAVIGLSSKPLHVYGRPTYTCQYNPLHASNATTTTTLGRKILPDWGYGRVYTVVVINCTFSPGTAAEDSVSGGQLLLHANTNGVFDRDLNLTNTILALTEPANSWSASQFLSPPKYDFLYCGSPLYGPLSPQRVREWIAYHVRLFGEKSHLVIHDAGGVHPEVLEVLRPWMELGFVTLEDVKEQERFDGYYHNQFLIVNDCLHRYRFDTKWMFFFDLDEFIFVPGKLSFRSVIESFGNYTQFTIEQMPMSNQLCRSEDAGKIPRKWAFEKLVYKNVKKVARKDRKYAVQPRNVFATGVHLSKHFMGESFQRTDKLIKYFHYHGTIAVRREPCRRLVNDSSVSVDDTPYVLDTTMRSIAPLVKRFELDTIGPRLQSTRQ